MKKVLLYLFIAASGCLFGQENSLLTSKTLKKGNWCSSSYFPSLHVGDTIVFGKKERKHCTNAMRFGTSNRILVEQFGNSYDGKPFVEFKEKGKWQLVNNHGRQILILDFAKRKLELQFINSKSDFLEFVVKTRSDI